MFPFANAPLGEYNKQPVPEMALVFHAHNGGYDITQHTISHRSGRYNIDAGIAIGPNTLHALLIAMQPEDNLQTELLPPNTLVHSPIQSVWYTPPLRRRMYIRAGKETLTLNVPWPALVFHVRNRKLAIAAIKGSRRPGESTSLYHAPLMNIYANGNLCSGSIALPDTCRVTDFPVWEAAIFDTLFTHVNHPKTLRLANTSHRNGTRSREITTAAHVRFWRDLHRTKTRRFPVSALVPMDCELDQFIRRHAT